MRVLHINSNYLGTGLHQQMVEALSKEQIENTVFTPISDHYEIRVKAKDDVIVRRCFLEADRLLFPWKEHKIKRALYDAVNPFDFDLFHAYTLFTDGNIAMQLSQKTGKPFVVAVRNTDINTFFKKRPLLRSRGRQILRKASAVFFLSRSYQDLLMQNYIPTEEREALAAKSHVIPNGIDPFWLMNRFETRNAPQRLDGGMRLILAGKLHDNKNPQAVVQAAEILREKKLNATVTLVGKKADEKLCMRLSRAPFVQILPPVPKEDLIQLYRQADIFVMPSFRESFGLVYAEALSQGLPVLYTAGQGFDGQFRDGVVGYAVDPHNPADIAEKILLAAEQYGALSENCLESSKQFDWNKLALQYRSIYEAIL